VRSVKQLTAMTWRRYAKARQLRLDARPFYAGELLLDHNNAETYRRVDEVREWIERYAKENP
jgi:hypothetical protein